MNDLIKADDTLIRPELQQRINKIEAFPALPEIYTKLVSELSGNDDSIIRVALIVSQDIGLSAKLLQAVNSLLTFLIICLKILRVYYQSSISFGKFIE